MLKVSNLCEMFHGFSIHHRVLRLFREVLSKSQISFLYFLIRNIVIILILIWQTDEGYRKVAL